MPELWYTIGAGLLMPPSLRTQDFAKGCADIARWRGEDKTTACVARMTLNVVFSGKRNFYRVVWRPQFQAASILAASTSMIGISSWTGYTRRHSPHFRLAPLALRTTGFLQTGQTSMSSRSCEIIAATLYSEPGSARIQPR